MRTCPKYEYLTSFGDGNAGTAPHANRSINTVRAHRVLWPLELWSPKQSGDILVEILIIPDHVRCFLSPLFVNQRTWMKSI